MEEMRMQEEQEEQAPTLPFGAKAGVFLGAAGVAGITDAIQHWGVTGLALGGFTAFLLAKTSPQMYAEIKKHCGFLPTHSSQSQGERTVWDRLTNHYPESGEDIADQQEMDYYAYLQTPEWRARADAAKARAGHRCQDCKRAVPLDAHHLTYDRLGDELPEDLVALCRTCHDARHGIVLRDELADEMEALQPKPVRAQLAPPAAALRAPTAQRAFFTFSELLVSGFRPSLTRIYLCTLEDGTQVFVPASKLCHVALAGLTRGGKSHLIRELMIQLCYAGAEVYHLDPHYTAYDLEALDPTGAHCPEDWTPFLSYLSNDPRELVPVRQKYQIIEHYLKGAKQMVEERMEMRGRSVAVGSPVFLFIDELPAIVDHIPGAPGCLKSILREGAKVGVYVVTASQDFLVKTLFPNEGGAIRDCYRTVLYVGGDAQTARILLDMPAKDVPENRMGKGRVMVRCDVVRPAQEARVPYVDNQALYALLGPSTYVPEDEEDGGPVTGPQLRPASTEDLPAVPPTEHRTAPDARVSGYDYHRERMTEQRRVRQAMRHEITQARIQAQVTTAVQEQGGALTREEQTVMDAYLAGAKSGNAIAARTDINATRANKILNKLAGQNLIDWQPRNK